jgi:hypothetical protein
MILTDTHRRALTLLDSAGPGGCTDVILNDVHGIKLPVLAHLTREGLASAAPEGVRAGGRLIEMTRVRITDDGRRALAGP